MTGDGVTGWVFGELCGGVSAQVYVVTEVLGCGWVEWVYDALGGNGGVID